MKARGISEASLQLRPVAAHEHAHHGSARWQLGDFAECLVKWPVTFRWIVIAGAGVPLCRGAAALVHDNHRAIVCEGGRAAPAFQKAWKVLNPTAVTPGNSRNDPRQKGGV